MGFILELELSQKLKSDEWKKISNFITGSMLTFRFYQYGFEFRKIILELSLTISNSKCFEQKQKFNYSLNYQ